MSGPNPLAAMPTMASDLGRVESELSVHARSDDPYLTRISGHLISAGGKRVRPGFAIAAAATIAGAPDVTPHDVILGGVAVELVHLGSLYHDDVMDDATTRRNVASVNATWGNLQAILAGDFLLARASEIAAGLGVEVAALLANTIARLCEGQVLELRTTFDPTRDEASYLKSIDGKTAALLATACRVGGLVADADPEHLEALTTFGRAYGIAFQMVDDVLDLVATDDALGKPAGHDMVEGVYTLPVIRALAGPRGSELASLLGDAMSQADRAAALAIGRDGPWIDSVISDARRHAQLAADAIASLPDSHGRRGLMAAAAHLVDSVEAAAAA